MQTRGAELESFGVVNFGMHFLRWWYGEAIRRIFVYFKAFYITIWDFFSVSIIARTFFDPWKRDISTAMPGSMIEERIRMWVMNLVSRIIGIIIKTITLGFYVISFFVLTALEIVIIFLWIFMPAIVLLLVLFGLQTIFLS